MEELNLDEESFTFVVTSAGTIPPTVASFWADVLTTTGTKTTMELETCGE